MKNQLICLILLFTSFATVTAQRQMMQPPINEADMKRMEAEIAEFQKEIESLSPEEQASFFKSMEEAVQKIDDLSKTEEGKVLLDKLDKGNISDEELDQLINQIVGEEEAAEAPLPVEEPKEQPKPVAKPKPVMSSKHEQAVDNVNAIIAHSNAFIVKATTVPELPGKIIKWHKSKLVEWQPGLTWNKLKTDIEQLVSNLNILLERDQKTKEYYHIDELLKEESLYNNLKKMLHTLREYEPRIEEISPLHKSLNKSSKQAFQKILTQYNEALYTLRVIEELKKLVAKFQPKAKVAREEEEKAYQKAELEKKKKLMPGAPITVGTPEARYPSARERSSDIVSEPSVPTPSHPVYFPSAPEGIERTVPTGSKSASGRGRKKDKAAKEEKDKEEKEDKKESDKEEEGDTKDGKKKDRFSSLKKRAEKIDAKVFKEADALVEKISENIKSIADLIKKTALFENLNNHLVDESDINVEFATETMPELMRELSMRRGALGNIEQLHHKLATPQAREKYKKELEKLFDKHKNQLESILNQLGAIEANWATLATSIPKSKQYAYFAQEIDIPEELPQAEIDKKLEEIEEKSTSVEEGLEKAVAYLQEKKQVVDTKLAHAQQKIPTPISLFELKKNIALLKDMISKFDQTTLPK